MSSPTTFLPSLESDSLLASPSKSRAAAITARNWSTVTSWLTELFSPSPVPPFEHNDTTLAYLLSLVHANDAADTESELLHSAKVEALQELEAAKPRVADPISPPQSLLTALSISFSSTAQFYLSDLASTTLTLGILPPYTTASLVTAITKLAHSTFVAQAHADRLSALESQLKYEIAQTQSAIASLTNVATTNSEEDPTSTTTLRAQTALWTRETKHLQLKAAEYRDRVATQTQSTAGILASSPSFADVLAQESRLEASQQRVRALEVRLAAYHGLPADVEVAREEVRRAQGELGELKRRREDLFARMAERR